jgi:hypothetical protein
MGKRASDIGAKLPKDKILWTEEIKDILSKPILV